MDLLDLLAATEAAAAQAAADPNPLLAAHMVLPNMSLACGRDLLATSRAATAAWQAARRDTQAHAQLDGHARTTAGHGAGSVNGWPRILAYSPEHVTCPDCLAAGDLAELCAGMQRRTAPTTRAAAHTRADHTDAGQTDAEETPR